MAGFWLELYWLRKTRHPHGSRLARTRGARVTGLAASGLQALTLLQRSKKKKEGCKTSDCSPCCGFLPADFHP